MTKVNKIIKVNFSCLAEKKKGEILHGAGQNGGKLFIRDFKPLLRPMYEFD